MYLPDVLVERWAGEQCYTKVTRILRALRQKLTHNITQCVLGFRAVPELTQLLQAKRVSP